MTYEERMQDLRRRFGTVKFDDKEYILLEQAYTDNPDPGDHAYMACAVRADEVDHDVHEVPVYHVLWDITNDRQELYDREEKLEHELEYDDRTGILIRNDAYYDLESVQEKLFDEGDACDWDLPRAVFDSGLALDLEDMRTF